MPFSDDSKPPAISVGSPCTYPGCKDPEMTMTLFDGCWFDGALAEYSLVNGSQQYVHMHGLRIAAWLRAADPGATEMKVIEALAMLDNWVVPIPGPGSAEADSLAWKRPVVRSVLNLILGRDAAVVDELTTGPEDTRIQRALDALGWEGQDDGGA